MSSSYAAPFERLDGALDEIAAIDPTYRRSQEKQAAMVGLSRVIARAQAQLLRILVTAEDVAVVTGARTTAAWLAEATPGPPGRGESARGVGGRSRAALDRGGRSVGDRVGEPHAGAGDGGGVGGAAEGAG